MIMCKRCEKTKEQKDFIKNKRAKSGYSIICKECSNKEKRSYLDTKRDMIREYNRNKYYENHQENKQKKTEKSKKFRSDFPEEYKRIQSEWRLKNPDKVRVKALLRSKTQECKDKRNKRLRENKNDKDLPKIRARKILQAAVRVGYMIRPDKCENCLKKCKPDGHHDDYNKPLEVTWLCKICHAHKHNKLMDMKP